MRTGEPRRPAARDRGRVTEVRPRFLSSGLTRRQRRVYLAATAWFLFVAAAVSWPLYTLFNRIRPLLLGMPASLFTLAVLVVGSFVVGVALLRWEIRQGLIEEPEAASGADPADSEAAR